MQCVNLVVAHTKYRRFVVCLSYRGYVSVTPRSGRDVMRAWGCIASVAVSLFPGQTAKSHKQVSPARQPSCHLVPSTWCAVVAAQ